MGRIAVALSGGVDSSVAAVELMRAGHDVLALTMQLSDGISSTESIDAARSVADHLGIEHGVVDVMRPFRELVVDAYLDDYLSGRTPNPCVICNPRVKIDRLMSHANGLGIDMLATGHYCRTQSVDGRMRLLRGSDGEKDQSYFLYAVPQASLSRLLFPLGDMSKTQVREIARAEGLPVADRAESQDACFIGEEGRLAFIRANRADAGRPGPIVDQEGAVVGHHEGIEVFTIGQRRGTGVAAGQPVFVTGLDAGSATVFVGPHSALATTKVTADELSWHEDSDSGSCSFMHRYRSTPMAGEYEITGDRLTVHCLDQVEAVAPGQALVCYKGDTLLGGGTIREAT